MKSDKRIITVDPFEHDLLLNGFNEFRNKIINEDKPTEDVDKLDNKYALLFLRGERPIQDFKYNILKHPNVSMTTDGKEKPYIHGFSDYSLGELCYENSTSTEENEKNESMDNIDFVIYSSEEIEDLLRDNEEEKSNEKI